MAKTESYKETYKKVDGAITDMMLASDLATKEKKHLLREIKSSVNQWLILLSFCEDFDKS